MVLTVNPTTFGNVKINICENLTFHLQDLSSIVYSAILVSLATLSSQPVLVHVIQSGLTSKIFFTWYFEHFVK